jgi:hypothetical protein
MLMLWLIIILAIAAIIFFLGLSAEERKELDSKNMIAANFYVKYPEEYQKIKESEYKFNLCTHLDYCQNPLKRYVHRGDCYSCRELYEFEQKLIKPICYNDREKC